MNHSVAENVSEIETLVSILLSTLDESIFFPKLGHFLHSQMNCDHTIIKLVLESGDIQEISKNGSFIQEGDISEKGQGVAGHVQRTKQPYFCNDSSRDPLLQKEHQSGIVSELAIPLVQEGIVIATLHFQSKHSERSFSRQDIVNVKSVLNQIQLPLSNMKMYLSAKHLNMALMKKIEAKEKEILKKNIEPSGNSSFQIEEKEIVGRSKVMNELLHVADKVATSDINALILGDRGVGKEMIARRIHCRSFRKGKSFLSIDCSTLQEDELEREIFGQEIGHFNDVQIKNGLIELANGGTLFLNNIERLSLSLQSKIYNFINEGMAFRIGGHMPYRSNVKLIVASTKDLNALITEGTIREDFLYSVNTVVLKVPSLKERGEDIERLAYHFLNEKKSVEEHKSFSPGAIKCLQEYPWPGNVRELQNIVERAYILSDSKIVEKEHLSDNVVNQKVELESKEEKKSSLEYQQVTLDELERQHICQTLGHLSGNKTKTAKALGITVKTLYNKLHSYGMINNQKEA